MTNQKYIAPVVFWHESFYLKLLKATSLFFLVTLFLFSLLLCSSLFAAERVFNDTFSATVLSVYDGDTITVNLNGVPEVFGSKLGVRVYGVDTPEIKGPHKREAVKARDYVRSVCKVGSTVSLSNIRRDKYFRLDADIECGGVNVAKELLKRGLGKQYFGGKKE